MGSLFTREHEEVENIGISTVYTYRYPPSSGNFFADHFIMGGQKFDSPQRESYLFGENNDLNYLNPKPVQFPYPSPAGNEPTKTLRSLVYLRKDSLRLVQCSDTEDDLYHIEFTFDADVKCAVSVHYLATEDLSSGLAQYTSKDPSMTSARFQYPKGAGQVFSNASRHRINPGQLNEDELFYTALSPRIPVVIQLDADEDDFLGHSNITLATFEKSSDGLYSIKAIKQKQMVDGLCYLLQEIYGIENKAMNQKNPKDEHEDSDNEENGLECVICMCDMRDTLILPCRHLCLCKGCADNLRYQASNCPICRSPFHALLQICAYTRKARHPRATGSHHQETSVREEEGASHIAGYEEISLVEALNGKIPAAAEEGALTRLARRSSSIRASARRALSRASSSKSQRAVERSLSAGSSISRHSRPGSSVARRRLREEAELSDGEADVEEVVEEEEHSVVEQAPALPEKEDAVAVVDVPEECVDDVVHVDAEQVTSRSSPVLAEEQEEGDELPELQVHVDVDVSLPGTPLSSETSGRSSRSNISSHSSGSIIPTTPTHVRLEDNGPSVTT